MNYKLNILFSKVEMITSNIKYTNVNAIKNTNVLTVLPKNNPQLGQVTFFNSGKACLINGNRA